jgi:hypothetical protein
MMPGTAMLHDLTPDCSRCEALCCVLLAFDASESFAHDKPACTACPNLAPDNDCTIHAGLSARGYAGCAGFTCHGAGQRLTTELYKSQSWRDDPGLLPAMADRFRHLRNLHEALWLLGQAAALPLTEALESERQTLLRTLTRSDHPADHPADLPPDLGQVQPFLRSLRAVTAPRR